MAHESPDFMITRRRLLWLPATLALAPAWLGGRRASAAAAPEIGQPLSLDEFLKAAQVVARELVRDGSRAGQDAYLYRLAALAVRLGSEPNRQLYPMGDFAPGVSLAPAFRGVPFVVIEWRLAAGARIPAHDHPSYAVCTVGLEGEAEVEHYEAVGPSANPAHAQVRKTRTALLVPGGIDTLSAYRDNIHQFRAGSRGARGFDITTLFGSDTGFHWIEMTASARNVGEAVAATLRRGDKR